MKTCSKCKKEKSLQEFHNSSFTLDGKDIRCKECNRLKHVKWYATKGKTASKQYQLAHKLQYAQNSRKYRSTDKGYYSLLKWKRKEKVLFTLSEFIEWNKNQVRNCFYCEMPERLANIHPLNIHSKGYKRYRLTLDRKDPNQSYSFSNMVLACWMCNRTKSNVFNAKEFKEIAMKYIKPKWENITL